MNDFAVCSGCRYARTYTCDSRRTRSVIPASQPEGGDGVVPRGLHALVERLRHRDVIRHRDVEEARGVGLPGQGRDSMFLSRLFRPFGSTWIRIHGLQVVASLLPPQQKAALKERVRRLDTRLLVPNLRG